MEATIPQTSSQTDVPPQGSGTPSPPINCGQLVLTGAPLRAVGDVNAARLIFQCMRGAIQTCTPATLTVTERETGFIRQFAVLGDESCTIREALQTHASAQPAIGDCAQTQIVGGSILFRDCSHLGDFTFSIPE